MAIAPNGCGAPKRLANQRAPQVSTGTIVATPHYK
jgi:hypothetical protein